MKMETPEEKAKRIGVVFLPFTPEPVVIIEENNNDWKKQVLDAIYKEVIAVCECGKEITIKDGEKPCGNPRCPFGRLEI